MHGVDMEPLWTLMGHGGGEAREEEMVHASADGA